MPPAIKSLISGLGQEALLRFVLATAGLGLAFALALFSTVARESGHLAATALLASLALLLAGVVGVATVPYLARKLAVPRVRDAFEYDVTREGMAYLALTLAIALAALNTGNNLLFIVVSALLAAVVVSGVASAFMLRGLELDIQIPAQVFAGQKVLARITLRNLRRRAPAFSVSLAPPRRGRVRVRWRWQPSAFGFPFKRPAERQWFRLRDLALRRVAEGGKEEGILGGSIYFPFVAAASWAQADVELLFAKRGRYQQDTFGLSTRFPFAFLVKTRRVRLAREVIVYPSVESAEAFFEALPMITGEFEAFLRGRGHDLYRIREYMPEDSKRHVDWKATARSLSLKVREFTREDERKLRLVFDNPAPGTVSESAYEKAVTLAASLAWHFAEERTELSFAAPGYSGSSEIWDILQYLALVEPHAGQSALEDLQVTDDYNIVLTARPRGTIATEMWARCYFLFIE